MDSLILTVESLTIQEATESNNKTQGLEQASYSYPEYDLYISEHVFSVTWYKASKRDKHIREHDTNIMGSFQCTNAECKKRGWLSKKIAITIRLYKDNKYNSIVYNQRCKQCHKLGHMAVDVDSYTERVVYRLKKWLGYEVEALQYTGKSKGPHESSLCEGCVGHCPQILTASFVDWAGVVEIKFRYSPAEEFIIECPGFYTSSEEMIFSP